MSNQLDRTCRRHDRWRGTVPRRRGPRYADGTTCLEERTQPAASRHVDLPRLLALVVHFLVTDNGLICDVVVPASGELDRRRRRVVPDQLGTVCRLGRRIEIRSWLFDVRQRPRQGSDLNLLARHQRHDRMLSVQRVLAL
jgi:hypothetical protein